MDHLAQAEFSLSRRDLTDAAQHFDRARQNQLSADRIDAGLWQLHMLTGDFEQAWRASDRIGARSARDPHRLWTGEPIAGKDILVRSLHGLGDAVQMFQYASHLKLLAKSVTWQVPPNLIELAQYFQDVDRLITWEQPCSWDLQIEITELPYLFRTTLPQLPLATRYLHLPTQPIGRSVPRIGFVWAAGEWNQSRSISLTALEPILRTARGDLVSLQGGPNPELHPRLNTIETGLLSLATTIASLDLLITVDTLAAHLGGALGVRTFVLLEYAADWRWMMQRNDSPWYSSLRLFRQPAPGDWAAPVQAIQERLGTLTP